jgi:hypothetical protein
MTKSEHHLFRALLPAYTRHLAQNKHSLIAKIYGMFRIQLKNMVEVYLLLMENTL